MFTPFNPFTLASSSIAFCWLPLPALATTPSFDGGEDKAFAKAALGGVTTHGRGFASAVAAYRLFACIAMVDPATNDEDVAGGVKDTFAGCGDKPSAEAFAGGGTTTPCGSEGAVAEAFRSALRRRRQR